MTEKSLYEQALANAARYSKPPAHDPVHAGIACLGVAVVIVSIFCGFARIDADSVAGSIGITAGVAFACGFFYVRFQENRHAEAVAREYEFLRQAAPPSAD